MAINIALLSFEFDQIDDIYYDPAIDHSFERHDPYPGEAIQPIIAEAVARIKRSMAASISDIFAFGQLKITNMSNFLHMATMTYDLAIPKPNFAQATTCIIASAKFFLLDKQITYKCTLDIEEIPCSATNPYDRFAYQGLMTNKQVEKLAGLLNKEFNLYNQIEFLPIIKRGRLDRPHYLPTSDERIMEYDFDKLLYSKKSEFQDIKIVSSPTLGNTLILDNLQNLAEMDVEYTYTLMGSGEINYKDKEVLILGGGDGALLSDLLTQNPKFVTMAEIDPDVIDACRQFMRPFGQVLENLEGPRHKIVIDDCLKLLRQSYEEGKKYDVIFNDLTDIPVTKRAESLTAFDTSVHQRQSPWHFIESIFNASMACLKPGGLYINHASGKGSKRALEDYEKFLKNSKANIEWTHREAFVPSFMEYWVFYTITLKSPFTISDKKSVGCSSKSS